MLIIAYDPSPLTENLVLAFEMTLPSNYTSSFIYWNEDLTTSSTLEWGWF